MGVAGLPTSLLVDDRGRLLGAIEGPLEWDGPEAVRRTIPRLVRPMPGLLPIPRDTLYRPFNSVPRKPVPR